MDSDHSMWLARVNAETQNQLASPLALFLAALPKLPTRKARTSAERGRAFRERQRVYEEELERVVGRLRKEVDSLEMRRKVRETRSLNTPASPSGSYVQTIYEYHKLFRHGLLLTPDLAQLGQKRAIMDDHVAKRIALQEEFIRKVIDPLAVVGGMVGPEASIVQWRRYTQSHASMTADVNSIQVASTDDDNGTVTVVANITLRVRFSRETFQMMFPYVLHDEAFLQRLIGKEIAYPSCKHFQFTRDGRIGVETVDVDFVGGLVNAGLSLADVSQLLNQSAISKDSMILEVEEPPRRQIAHDELTTQATDDERTTPSSPADSQSSDTSKRLSVSFILSDVPAA